MNPYGSNYFDPGSLYGSSVDYSTSPIVGGPGGYLANNPQAAFARFVAPFAGGNDPFSAWVRNQYARAYGGFNAATATNPSLGFGYGPPQQDYLRTLGPEFFRNQWQGLSSPQRGVDMPRFGGGRVTWQKQYL